MSPWQLERKNDPRKPKIDVVPRTRTDGKRDDRQHDDRPETTQIRIRPIIIDDGE